MKKSLILAYLFFQINNCCADSITLNEILNGFYGNIDSCARAFGSYYNFGSNDDTYHPSPLSSEQAQQVIVFCKRALNEYDNYDMFHRPVPPFVETRLIRAYLSAKQYKQARKLLMSVLNTPTTKDDPTALWLSGYMAEYGLGQNKSISQATADYQRAAEQDFPPAQYSLGCLLLKTNDNPVSAQKWLTSAEAAQYHRPLQIDRVLAYRNLVGNRACTTWWIYPWQLYFVTPTKLNNAHMVLLPIAERDFFAVQALNAIKAFTKQAQSSLPYCWVES